VTVGLLRPCVVNNIYMYRMVLFTIIFAVVAYVGLCAVMFLFQRSFIYYPRPRGGDSGARLMPMPIDEGEVLVSVKRREGGAAVIYFGGNAEDVSTGMPQLSEAFPDSSIYLMHYRGYGGSAGSPSEEALFADALALFDRVRETHPDITVIGRSLGSSVAVYLAGTRDVSRLILITPFDSMTDIAARQFPFLPVNWLLIDRYESFRYAPHVKAPTLIITAEHDELIPPESSRKLYTRFAPGVASFHVVPGTNHNNISFSPEYL
jgi:uncharacterized protein